MLGATISNRAPNGCPGLVIWTHFFDIIHVCMLPEDLNVVRRNTKLNQYLLATDLGGGLGEGVQAEVV